MSEPCEFCRMNAESVVTVEIENAVLLGVLKKICTELEEQQRTKTINESAWYVAQRAIKEFTN